MTIHDDTTRISRIEDNTRACIANIKNTQSWTYEQACAAANQFGLVSDERPQRFTDVMPDDKICKVILFRRFVVDDD
jgi:hypothetical protein